MAKKVFVDGNPQQGIQGTIVDANFLNKLNNQRHTGRDIDGEGALDYAADTGQANQYEIELSPELDAHIIGMPIRFKAANTCTGASTFKVNAFDPVSIQKNVDQNLESSDIVAGQIVCVAYDGENYQLLNVAVSSDSRVPTGATIYVPANTPPAGYIKKNGALLSRATYAALWAFAQNSGNIVASDGEWTAGKFSPGDGSTTFRIPDGRGEFTRGWDDGRGVDSGRAIGSSQADDFKLHSHLIGQNYNTLNGSSGGDLVVKSAGFNVDIYSGSIGGAETRPRNIAELACIKY